MDRRRFARNAAGLAGALALGGAGLRVRAAEPGFVPTEGRDFERLERPVGVPADGKIEVIEFFWYGCPHCFAFEPVLEEWVPRLPADVRFSRVPVGFNARQQIHQRIFYTWEALGVLDTMHPRTFVRFHALHKPVDSIGDMVAFAQENGLDGAKVTSAWNSFSVQSKCVAARKLEDDYGVERMPQIAVGGRYLASGSPVNLLTTTELLLGRLRRGA